VRDAVEHRLARLLLDAHPAGLPCERADVERLCADAEAHGVLPLVADRLRAIPGAAPELAAEVRRRTNRAAALDLVRERALQQLLGQCNDAGVVPILLKGAHLAYSVYARPDLRPREDSDLLIDARDRPRMLQLLERHGYEPVPQTSGDLLMYQAPFVRRSAGAVIHTVDVHWRLANPQRFGSVLSYDDLRATSVAVPALSPHAVAPSTIHALLIACVHRIAHHYDAARLIWTFDMHLLAGSLDERMWQTFVDEARRRHVAAVCARSLDLARTTLRTRVPAAVIETLARTARLEPDAAAYLRQGGHARRVAADMRLLPWAQRWALARQHLFPPAAYMRAVYAPASAAPLPVLYAWRAWRGARRWFARS
jgi:hypothetical protein